MGRDYAELSPFDFECLVRDLLQKQLGSVLHVFPIGRDGGVDVAGQVAGRRIVAQCKHSPGRGFSDVRGALAKEARRVQGREFGEYWLATSASLTRQNKEEIARMFESVGLVPERVLGRLDIDNLLNLNPAIEKIHYKLWFASSSAVQQLLHPEAQFRSGSITEEIGRRLRLFVQTDSFAEAMDVIARHRVCILSGPPGVGKTTIAQVLLLQLADQGHQRHFIVEDIAEAERQFCETEKQVFFYDDFLGQTALDQKLPGSGDRRLSIFMDRVSRSASHYLILTTREYILRDAQKTYELLRPSRIDIYKYIVGIDRITPRQRAQILYNHIYFAELPPVAVNDFVKSHIYLQLILSNRFNPRLIEFAIATYRSSLESGDVSIGRHIRNVFSRPNELWGHIFNHQLSSDHRTFLWAVVFSSRSLDLSATRKTMAAFHGEPGGVWPTTQLVRATVKHLSGSFIRTRLRRPTFTPYVQISVPSLVDHMKSILDTEPGLVLEYTHLLPYFEQLAEMLNWASGTDQGYAFDIAESLGYRRQGRFLEGLSASLAECGQLVLAEMIERISRDSPGLYLVMPLDVRVLRVLDFAQRYNVSVGKQECRRISEQLLDFWLTTDASKDVAVEIYEVTSRMPPSVRDRFAYVRENVTAWVDISLSEIDDHTLRRRVHASTGFSYRSNSELLKEFLEYSCLRLRELDDVDDIADAVALVRELMHAVEGWGLTGLSRQVSAAHYQLTKDLGAHYEKLLGRRYEATPTYNQPRQLSALTEIEVAEINTLFASLIVDNQRPE